MKNVNGHLGETRSAYSREYLLHTPDAFVRAPLPSIIRGLAIVHASARLGADFLQYTAELEGGGELRPAGDLQRFLWILEGELTAIVNGRIRVLGPGDYAYLPARYAESFTASCDSRVAVIEKRYEGFAGGGSAPGTLVSSEAENAPVPLGGDPDILVRTLLPTNRAFDFAVNTMTYAAGAALSQVEIHVMEHGLLMLEGSGTYRLGGDWYEVQQGDFIWMAPFCPQWFRAAKNEAAKYLIYKDWNRRPRL